MRLVQLRALGLLDQGDRAAYVNFVGTGQWRAPDAYPPATWERLRAVKASYDADNLLRDNHNILRPRPDPSGPPSEVRQAFRRRRLQRAQDCLIGVPSVIELS